jgi:hypothetical protein
MTPTEYKELIKKDTLRIGLDPEVKLDVYQSLVLNAINTYGSGDWKNGVSVHHKHESSQFSNLIIGGEVVAKIVYDVAHDDISQDDYRAIHIDKTKTAKVSYIAFGNDLWEYRKNTQIARYKNILDKLGFIILIIDNSQIVY